MFSTNLNRDWYQSGSTLNNTSLAKTKLEPNESKELKLILTKAMTNSNTGLINNKAQIEKNYNSQGTQDNNINDDTGSADVILGIKTGAAISYVLLTISIVIIIWGSIYILIRKRESKEQIL